MEISTKFNKGETVYLFDNDFKVIKGEIEEIKIVNSNISYKIEANCYSINLCQDNVFKTIEHAISEATRCYINRLAYHQSSIPFHKKEIMKLVIKSLTRDL